MDLGTLWFSDSIVQLISNLCFVLAGFLLFEDFFLSLLIFAENNCKIVSEERVLRILSLPWEDITQMLIWWRLPVLLFGLFHWKVNGVHSRFTLLKVPCLDLMEIRNEYLNKFTIPKFLKCRLFDSPRFKSS